MSSELQWEVPPQASYIIQRKFQKIQRKILKVMQSVQTIYEMLRSQTLCRVQGRGDCEEENEEKEETASMQGFQLMVVHARWCECCSRVTGQSCLSEKNSFQTG